MINYKMFIFIILFVFVANTSRLYSAEKPLGIITEVNDAIANVEFDSSVYLQPGTMVAMYGGGTVKRYPLTDEVAVKDLEHIATGQIIGKGGNILRVRRTWKKPEFEIKIGMNAVPLSDEAAPNSPPIQFSEINDISAPIQSSVPLEFPIKDPDRDRVLFDWELIGEEGRVGFLAAQTTRIPENTWFTPAVESKAIVTVKATDSYGQSLTCSMNLSSSMWSDGWRNRELTPFRIVGNDVSGNSLFLTRDDRGNWWSLTDEGVFRISPGWFKSRQFLADQNPRAMAAFEDLIHFVGKNSAGVRVLDSKGAVKRTYGFQSNPTDIVVGDNGIVFVADQSLGGIQVYESNGMFRCTLGRAGEGRDYFSKLMRITLDGNGQIFALDQDSAVLHRFGRFQERLSSWTLNLTGKQIAKDLCWHPKGELLVLINDGRILRFDSQGRKSKHVINPSSDKIYFNDVVSPESLYVDLAGNIFVTYPTSGIIARYTENGDLYGVRGAPFWGLSRFAMDAYGGGCALYGSSPVVLTVDPEGWITQNIGMARLKGVRLKNPSKLAVSPDGDTLVIIDSDNNQIVQYDLAGGTAPTVFGQPGKNDGQFESLTDVVLDDYGHIYVLDSKLCRISVFDRNGHFIFGFGQKGKSASELRKPSLLAVRPGGQAAYVCDGYEIKKFTIDYPQRFASHSGNAGGKGRGPGQLLEPTAIACDRQGLLYILDNDREDLQVVDFRGKNAIGIYAQPYKKWGFQKVSEMTLNVDGKPCLVHTGRFVGLTWAK